MWVPRPKERAKLKQDLLGLNNQVLVVRGARQVGKTSLVTSVLDELGDYPSLELNLLYPSSLKLSGREFYGKDFFGSAENGEQLLKNIDLKFPNLRPEKPLLVFIDEADSYPSSLESIQTLATFSETIKFVFTGSNLENILTKNVSTGRKKYFDIYPLSFLDFLRALGRKSQEADSLLEVVESFTFSEDEQLSDYQHVNLLELSATYVRLGGMPRVIVSYLERPDDHKLLAETVRDLAYSIEENVKTVLGEKTKLYEYADILRSLTQLSSNSLQYSKLQVQHAGRAEAKKIVNKTVGARVAHKLRLWESEKELSKFILFDSGMASFLLEGSNLLRSKLSQKSRGILYETFVGNTLVRQLVDRSDLHYWKSGNRAELEFMLDGIGVDVKSKHGSLKSLASFGLHCEAARALVKVSADKPQMKRKYRAKLPTSEISRELPFFQIPHYLAPRLLDLVK